MATFNVQGNVVRKNTGLGISYAKVQVYQLGQTAPLAVVTTEPDGSFELTFNWPKDVTVQANRPDVHFKVIQMIDGADTVIYNEDPATETRHNIADVLAVNLEVDQGLALSKPEKDRKYDKHFVFTRIGLLGVDEIDTVETTVGTKASGYAHSDTSSAEPNSARANSPFGSTLHVAAWFGHLSDTDWYKIEYSSDGANWHEISDPLANRYYDFATATWLTMKMGPFTHDGVSNVYRLPYSGQATQLSAPKPWIFPDLIAKWDTTKVADGRYTLRIKGFRQAGKEPTKLKPAQQLVSDPSYGELRLRIDNTAPTSKLKEIRYATHAGDALKVTDVCSIIEIADGKIEIDFEAEDAAGHLRSYQLDAFYGHHKKVSPRPDQAEDNYSQHVDSTRQWKGGTSYTVVYDAAGTHPHDYTAHRMPKCAYQFRLGVAKRTTNGYGLVYRGREDTKHLTIQRI